MMSQPDPVNSPATEFLTNLFGVTEQGYISLWSKGDEGSVTDWAPATDPVAAAAAAMHRAHDHNVYMGVATRKERLSGNRRGGVEDCLDLPALYADIDTSSGVHAISNLPTNEQGLQFALTALGLAPSIINFSGGGYHVYWLLAEANAVTDLTDSKVLARWKATLQRLAFEQGWHLDNVFNVDRVLRVPGTFNYKGEEPRLVETVHADYDRRYGIDDIEEALDAYVEPPVAQKKSNIPYVGAQRPGDAFNLTNTGGQILSQLGFNLVEVDRNGDEKYTHPWKPAKKGDHSVVVHRASGNTVNYSDTVVAKWPAFRLTTEINPATGKGYAFDPFGLYIATQHGGDIGAATAALADGGYGTRYVPPEELEAFIPKYNPAADAWRRPDTLTVALGTGRPFPAHVLPPWYRAQCELQAKTLQAPVDLLAMNGLGALSVATLGRVTIEGDWIQDLNAYLVSVLPSGMSKTPSFEAMLKVLRKMERELRADAKEAIARATIQRDAKLAQAETKKGAAAKKSEEEKDAIDDAIRLEREADEIDVPFDPRLITQDTTLEKLGDLLGLHGGRFCLIADEAQIFKTMAGAYSKDAANLDVANQGWSGGDLIVDRFGREVNIPHALLAFVVATQPLRINQIGRNEEMRGTGLTARFMYSVPVAKVGTRDRTPARRRGLDPKVVRQTQATYDDLMAAIFRTFQTKDPKHKSATTDWAAASSSFAAPDVVGEERELALRLTLTEEAIDAFAAWDQACEYRYAPGESMSHMVDWGMKLRGTVIRVAGLLHIAKHAETDPDSDKLRPRIKRLPTTVEVGTMLDALEIGNYWIDHATKVHAVWESAGEAIGLAGEIIEWAAGLNRRAGDARSEFTVVEAHSFIRASAGHRNEKVETVIDAIGLLADAGWVRTGSDFPGRRGAPSPVIKVHPEAGSLWVEDVERARSAGSSELTEQNGAHLSELSKPTPTDPALGLNPDEVLSYLSTELRRFSGPSSSLETPRASSISTATPLSTPVLRTQMAQTFLDPTSEPHPEAPGPTSRTVVADPQEAEPEWTGPF